MDGGFVVNWKRNLYFVWLSQFLSISGFSFALPFAPFYIQKLGVSDPVSLKMWVAVFAAVTPLALAISSPIWGILADRYGRRPMLLRAYYAGAIVLALMGLATSVEQLIVLRFIQGIFTGTVTASQTLISAHAPEGKSGTALGALGGAVFSGTMAGAFAGGWLAEFFGYRVAFFISGGILLLAAVLVTIGVRERFEAPPPKRFSEGFGHGVSQLAIAGPILMLIVALAFTRTFDQAMLPLLVQDIHGSTDGVAPWAGSLSAIGGLAGLLACFTLGPLADRISPARIGKWSALGSGLLMIPQGLAEGFLMLFVARFGMIFCAGGLDPVFQIWLAKVTPEKSRGFIFGWSTTAKSIGWFVAPLFGGALASAWGVRSIFFVGPLLYFALIPLIGFVVWKLLPPERD